MKNLSAGPPWRATTESASASTSWVDAEIVWAVCDQSGVQVKTYPYAEEAEAMVQAGEKVILVRRETSPEDIRGMQAAGSVPHV